MAQSTEQSVIKEIDDIQEKEDIQGTKYNKYYTKNIEEMNIRIKEIDDFIRIKESIPFYVNRLSKTDLNKITHDMIDDFNDLAYLLDKVYEMNSFSDNYNDVILKIINNTQYDISKVFDTIICINSIECIKEIFSIIQLSNKKDKIKFEKKLLSFRYMGKDGVLQWYHSVNPFSLDEIEHVLNILDIDEKYVLDQVVTEDKNILINSNDLELYRENVLLNSNNDQTYQVHLEQKQLNQEYIQTYTILSEFLDIFNKFNKFNLSSHQGESKSEYNKISSLNILKKTREFRVKIDTLKIQLLRNLE